MLRVVGISLNFSRSNIGHKNVPSNHVDEFLTRRMNKTVLRGYENKGRTYYPPRSYGRNSRLAALTTKNIHLDSLQSDPHYIKSIRKCHNFHRKGEKLTQRRYQMLIQGHYEGTNLFGVFSIIYNSYYAYK